MCQTHRVREGAASRMIRESEDLPGLKAQPPWTKVSLEILRIKKGHPRIDQSIGPGFFLDNGKHND